MIRTEFLTKSFGEVRALDGLDMHVPAGSVYGLVGPNGAGKTTALQHIAGVMRPSSGAALVDGQPTFGNPAVRERIAYVPSDFYYYRQASIADMAALHASLFPTFDRERFESLSELFQLDAKRAARSLSKGMGKQLAIILALAQHPDVLLLDEPLDGLDPSARRTVLSRVMDDVAERSMTVLVSSHNLRELTDICDHVGIMSAGRMQVERSLSTLQDGFAKVQVAFESPDAAPPAQLDVVHASTQGRLHTLVVRGDAAQVEEHLVAAGATFVNVLPLSLEEIFIYEVEGGSHENESVA